MNTSISEKPANSELPIERHVTMVSGELPTNPQSLDRTLVEIRSGRRLEKIANSIESFLHSQVTRLETALQQCQQAEHNDKIVQNILAEFELEKETWEEQRQAEIRRLDIASEQLSLGWQQLEDERRSWLDERNGR